MDRWSKRLFRKLNPLAISIEKGISTEEITIIAKTRLFIQLMNLISLILTIVLIFRILIIGDPLSKSLIPIVTLVMVLACTWATKYKNRLELCCTIFVIALTMLVTARLLQFTQMPVNHSLSLIILLPVLTMLCFVLKGKVWGFSIAAWYSIFIILSAMFLRDGKTGAHWWYFTINICLAIFIAATITSYYDWQQEILLSAVRRYEKKKTSVNIMNRLLHEIMNPLSVAMGYSRIMNKNSPSKEIETQMAMLERINQAVKKMSEYANADDLADLVETNDEEISITEVIESENK